MVRKVFYNSPSERLDLINQSRDAGEYWVGEGSTSEGNFLLFSPFPLEESPDPLDELEQELRSAETIDEIKGILIRRARDGTLTPERAFFAAAIL